MCRRPSYGVVSACLEPGAAEIDLMRTGGIGAVRDREHTLRAPVAVGLNLIDTPQLVNAARLAVQVVVFRKSPGLVPLRLIALMVSAVLWLLVTVTTLAALVVPLVTLPKLRLAGATVTCAAPVPASAALCGELLALSVTVTLADLEPSAMGLNFIEMVQLAKAARLAPQVVVFRKSPGFVPATTMPLMLNGVLRLLVSVRFFARLVLATATLPKFRPAGASVACTAEVP